MVGRVKTASGWQNKVLPPGEHTCWGRDDMYFCDSTEATYTEPLEILVGGKVNLNCKVTVRCGVDITKSEEVLAIFERVLAGEDNSITHKKLYEVYLQLVMQSVPRDVFGNQPDIDTVVASKGELSKEVEKLIIEGAKETPFKVTAVKITNYDWPDELTTAQIKLVEIQMEEKREEARVRADLEKAKGQLAVEEANKLVEMKKAEALAESIGIIKDKLQGAPEYLDWHRVRALAAAAEGPNNAFIIMPYGTRTEGMVANAQLRQMLENFNQPTEGSAAVPAPAAPPSAVSR
jgi:regulator of protease activity HflC (stomatin/prohibitin superfamily)